MTKKLGVKIAISIIFCLTLGIASGLNTANAIGNWYQYIQKPSWNPPNWLFGPVWTLLYILMGIAAARVWHKSNTLKNKDLALFLFQFALNLAWSTIFFSWHNIGGAFLEIIGMWLAIVATILQFKKTDSLAGYLLIPYLIWVTFAAFLNYTIWTLNP